ncbi:Retrovirus-related Pol polyprotein from transposon TNT 1-94, partial [Trametes pubescens]
CGNREKWASGRWRDNGRITEPAQSAERTPGPTTESEALSTARGEAAKPEPGSKPDPLASLSDDDYFAKVEAAETKIDEYEQKEFATCQQIYGTITDSLLLKVKDLLSASAVWSAVMKEHEGKSEMYASSVRTRLLNTRCSEGRDVREHFDTLVRLREELAGMGSPLPNAEFSAAIFQSLPESYGTLLTTLSTAARMTGNLLSPGDIIFAVSEEFDRRKLNTPGTSSKSALAAQSSTQLECYNCKRKGHVKADCWRKGGGKEGQGPKQQTAKRGRGRGRGGGGGRSANVAKAKVDDEECAFTTLALGSAARFEFNPHSRDRIEVYDSGATRHISPYRDTFISFTELDPPLPINTADGHSFSAVGEGSVHVEVPNGDSQTAVTLQRVLYAPEIAFALVSIPRADEAGFSAVFEKGECRLYRRSNQTTIGRIPLKDGLYQVRRQDVAAATGFGKGPDLKLTNHELHRRMGHISPFVSRSAVKQGRICGIKLTDNSTDEVCEACIQAKITRKPVPDERESELAEEYGERFHADTWTADVTSLGGNKYATMWTDDAKRWTRTVPQKEKSQALPAYKALEAEIETQEGRRIKQLQTDGGGEFWGIDFDNYVKSRGTFHRTSVHDTPEENGVSERVNRTLGEHSRAMLIDSGLPRSLWPYSMVHATWLKNRTPTRALKGLTPFEARYGKAPDLRDLHRFGAKVWVRKERSGKTESKAREGRFVGYSQKSKGYQVYWPDKRSVTVERNVRFVEDEPDAVEQDDAPLEGARQDKGEQPTSPSLPTTQTSETAGAPTPEATPPPVQPTPSSPASQTTVEDAPDEDDDEEEAAPPEPQLGRRQRVRKPSAYVRRLNEGKGTIDGHRSRHPRGVQASELMGAATRRATA